MNPSRTRPDPTPSAAQFRRLLEDEAARLGVALGDDELADRLARVLALLYLWNRRINLTALRDPREGARRHALEALVALPLLATVPGGRLVDLGSGNGFPALPILLARPDLVGTLFEVTERKCAFLRAAVHEAGLGGRAEIRHERLVAPGQLPVDTAIVSMRGFPEPLRWIPECFEPSSVRAVLAWLSLADGSTLREAGPSHGLAVRIESLPTHASGCIAVCTRRSAEA